MAKKSKSASVQKTAKKQTQKSAQKPAQKLAKKPAKKQASKLTRAAKSVPGPKTINTGKGAKPSEVGRQLVEMFNSRTDEHKIWQAIFAKDWDSVEGEGTNLVFEGRRAVLAKNEQWSAANAIITQKAEGPYCGSTGFVVRYSIELQDRASGARQTMEEMAFYTVKNGKIVREEFFYDYRAK